MLSGCPTAGPPISILALDEATLPYNRIKTLNIEFPFILKSHNLKKKLIYLQKKGEKTLTCPASTR